MLLLLLRKTVYEPELERLDPAIMGNELTMHDLYKYLREHDLVSYVEHHNYEPFWAIIRYDDVKFISQNNAPFINNPRTVLVQK